MKAVKTFVKSCYSEALVSTPSNVADNEREDGSLISEEADGTLAREPYHGLYVKPHSFRDQRLTEVSDISTLCLWSSRSG